MRRRRDWTLSTCVIPYSNCKGDCHVLVLEGDCLRAIDRHDFVG